MNVESSCFLFDFLSITLATEMGKYFSLVIHLFLVIPRIPLSARWEQIGKSVAGGHKKGSDVQQLNEPYSVLIVPDETMIIAESQNHSVVQWQIGDTNGQLLAGGNGAGNRLDQLNEPSDVVIDKGTDSLIICSRNNKQVVRWSRHNGNTQGELLINNISCYGLTVDEQGFLYVSDAKNHEVKRYRMPDMHETVVAGGHGKGDQNKQLRIPTFVFVDRQQTVYVTDNRNHRVMKWYKDATEGIVVAGGNGNGNAPTQLSDPNGLFVDMFDTVYVVDMGNNRVMRWLKGSTQGTIIAGGRGQGSDLNQFYSPVGLSFDRRGNLYVVDTGNHRVQRFSIE